MSTSMVVLDADVPVPNIAQALADRGVPAAPVIDDEGRVLGVVTGLDLLGRAQWYQPRSRWKGFGRRHEIRREQRQQTAAELMTSPAVTARMCDHLWQVAHRMVHNHLSSVPVIDDRGRLIGVVTREDLLREFTVPDEQILGEIEREVIDRLIWSEPHDMRVEVNYGMVTLYGRVERRSVAALTVASTRNLRGVAAVDDQIIYETDDTVATVIRPG